MSRPYGLVIPRDGGTGALRFAVMLTIRQTDTGWEVVSGSSVLATFDTYSQAMGRLVEMWGDGQIDRDTGRLAAMPDVGDDDIETADGLLPDTWEADLCFAAPTGDGRDFTECVWSSRDVNVSTLPLMDQTSTDMGHFGATLAGYFTEIDNLGAGSNPTARGRFYATEAGESLRDRLLAGRSFGISVDPGACAVEEDCLEVDDDGWCSSWVVNFLTYEIIGATATPFPGFANAAIRLGAPAAPIAASGATDDGCECGGTCATCQSRPAPVLSTWAVPAAPMISAVTAASSVTASVTAASSVVVDVRPPASWFADPALPCPSPLTITDQGRVLGHVAAWGTCHTGYEDRCVPPPRGSDYRDFMQGGVVGDDGERHPSGALTWGIAHADLSLAMIHAQAHYAISSAGWADVAVGEDKFGIWFSGALRPGLTDEDVRILRALALSGDWRHSRRTGRLEMIAALAVNHPGYPIPGITASGRTIASTLPRQMIVDDVPMALVASGMVPRSASDDRVAMLEARVSVLTARAGEPYRETLRADRRQRALARLRG